MEIRINQEERACQAEGTVGIKANKHGWSWCVQGRVEKINMFGKRAI